MKIEEKILSIFTNPTLPVTKGLELIGNITKKQPQTETETPSILKKIRHNGINFTYLINPQVESIQKLKAEYDFHPLHLDDIFSTVQRPKIDEEDDYIFFVFHFPQYNPDDNKIRSIEVDFFLTKTDLVAVVDPGFHPMEEIIERMETDKKEKEAYFSGNPGILFYRILDNLVDSIFPLLSRFEKDLEEIDQEVFSDDPKKVTIKLSYLRRNVIYFQSLIKPEMNSFIRIEQSKHPLITRELKTYLENITDHLKKIWDHLEDIIELSNNLAQTFESYMTFRTNQTIKVLTMFSVVLFFPITLLSGIYGMNLAYLPLAQHPDALIYITLLVLVMTVLMYVVFKLKRWI